MHYCRSLRFEDRPDYGFLRKMFKELMVKENIEYDYVFDWTFTEAPKKQSIHMGQQPGQRKHLHTLLEDPSSSLLLNPPQSQIMESAVKPNEGRKESENADAPKEGEGDKKSANKSGYAKSNTANFGSEEGEGKKKDVSEGEEKKEEKTDDAKPAKGKKKDGKQADEAKEEKDDDKKEVKKTMKDLFKQKGRALF